MFYAPTSASTKLALGGMIVTVLSVTMPVAQATDIGLVREGVLNVCTGGDFPPMQYYANPGDEKLVGFEVDVVDAIAKQWNATTKYVVGDFKGLLPSLGAERCDLVASGIMVTAERLKAYDAVPYFISNVVMVTAVADETTKTPQDLSGKVLAIEAGTTYEKTAADLNAELGKAGKAPAQIQTYPSASGVIEQILVGRAAATVGLKLYPNSWVGQEIRGWKMDDPEVAFPSFERAQALGIKVVAIHYTLFHNESRLLIVVHRQSR